MASVIELLLETLKNLSNRELRKYKNNIINDNDFEKRLSDIPLLLETTDMQDMVFLTVQTFGQQALAKTNQCLMEMKRTDLVQSLPKGSSGRKSKTVRTKICLSDESGSKHVSHNFIRCVSLLGKKDQYCLITLFITVAEKGQTHFKLRQQKQIDKTQAN